MSSKIVEYVFFSDESGNQRARLSLRKTAELLKVTQPALTKLLKGDNLFDVIEAEKIIEKGFEGDNLARLVAYYTTASRVSDETRKHNSDLMMKLAIIG